MAVKLHHDDDIGEVHEINVTPFIDVMLVLLIIFMVAAPLATVQQNVDLPSSNAAQQPKPDKPVYLTIRADRSLLLGDTPVVRQQLGGALDRLTGGDREQRVFVRADKTVDYDALMQAMNTLRDAGYLKVGLVGVEQMPGQ